MKWTTDKPTDPGWYWFQHWYTGEPLIAWIDYPILLSGDGQPPLLKANGKYIEDISNGKWAGPIPEPEEL